MKPKNIPIIPTIPAIALGAGIGSLNAEKIAPAINPVSKAFNISIKHLSLTAQQCPATPYTRTNLLYLFLISNAL